MRLPQIFSLFVFSLTYFACTVPSTIAEATGTQDQCAKPSLAHQILVPRGRDGPRWGPSYGSSGPELRCGDPGFVSMAWKSRSQHQTKYGKDNVWVVHQKMLPVGAIIKEIVINSQEDMTLLRTQILHLMRVRQFCDWGFSRSRKAGQREIWYIIQYDMGIPAADTALHDNSLAIIQKNTLSYYRRTYFIVPPDRIAADPDIYAYTQSPLDLRYRFGQDVKGWYGEIVSWMMADRIGEPVPPKAEEINVG